MLHQRLSPLHVERSFAAAARTPRFGMHDRLRATYVVSRLGLLPILNYESESRTAYPHPCSFINKSLMARAKILGFNPVLSRLPTCLCRLDVENDVCERRGLTSWRALGCNLATISFQKLWGELKGNSHSRLVIAVPGQSMPSSHLLYARRS